MSYRPYKFLVMPVVQEIAEDGTVIQEAQPEQPLTVFGVEGLIEFAQGFEETLVYARKEGDVRNRVDQPGAGRNGSDSNASRDPDLSRG